MHCTNKRSTKDSARRARTGRGIQLSGQSECDGVLGNQMTAADAMHDAVCS